MYLGFYLLTIFPKKAPTWISDRVGEIGEVVGTICMKIEMNSDTCEILLCIVFVVRMLHIS